MLVLVVVLEVFYYLFSLSDANLPELLAVTKRKDFNLADSRLKNYTGDLESRYHKETFVRQLRDKVYHFVSDYNNDCRSFDLRDQEITKSIYLKN